MRVDFFALKIGAAAGAPHLPRRPDESACDRMSRMSAELGMSLLVPGQKSPGPAAAAAASTRRSYPGTTPPRGRPETPRLR